MFNTRLIREDDALLQFEAFSWLIQNYGMPSRPPVPSPLHKTPQISDLKYDALDTRPVTLWAEDNFAAIKNICAMSTDEVHLIPVDEFERLELSGFEGERDYVVYDPTCCNETAYFPTAVLLQLADIRSRDLQGEAGLTLLTRNMVVLITGAYNGTGFSLANMVVDISDVITPSRAFRRMPYRLIENTLCFGTCLSLMVQRQSMEQIIATYGTLMPPSFRRKVRLACRQIETYKEDVKLLQVMTEPRKGDNLVDMGLRALSA